MSGVIGDELRSVGIETIQANVGLRCNQSCSHCHLEASPERRESMEWATMERVVAAARDAGCRQMDVTGGAPEMNPNLPRFIEALRAEGLSVQVRTNFTALLEPGNETLPAFFREHNVQLVGSMPCYLKENVEAQRGPGVHGRSIEVIRRLNRLGYGFSPEAALNLVYNPLGAFLPPAQEQLEADYRRELAGRFGVTFTRLLTIANMPIGRFKARLTAEGKEEAYQRLLEDSFNPDTIEGLMCRHQISVGWDGTLYDCDFNCALGLPLNHGAPNRVRDFDTAILSRRKIVTGDHCFGCTAGHGSSCRGALA
jgi:radical SAM/Cys-rich protein